MLATMNTPSKIRSPLTAKGSKVVYFCFLLRQIISSSSLADYNRDTIPSDIKVAQSPVALLVMVYGLRILDWKGSNESGIVQQRIRWRLQGGNREINQNRGLGWGVGITILGILGFQEYSPRDTSAVHSF